jgi:hypothetical protein
LKKSKTGKLIILALYVDDTMIAFDRVDTDEWFADKKCISDTYPIKDLGECRWFLNMKVIRDRTKRTIMLSQEAYIDHMVDVYGLIDSGVKPTPAEKGHDVSTCLSGIGKGDDALDARESNRYRSLVGSLLYAANITRPDITFVVGRLCRHVAAPLKHHMKTANQVLRYLKGTSDLCLIFGRTPITNLPMKPVIGVFSDSDYGGDRIDGKSTSGCLVRFNGDVISWYSKKQKVVSMSTTEAEYIALSEAVKEALWYSQWVFEVCKYKTRPSMYCDNTGAISLSGNDVIHDRSKHIRLRYHHVRDEVKVQKSIKVIHVSTQDQEADILTKSLEVTLLRRACEQLLCKL